MSDTTNPFQAKNVDCARCGAREGERCMDPQGKPGPYHVERGRDARWALMYTFPIALLIVALFCISSQAQLVIPPTSAECATSVDGSVVLVPNPLSVPQVAPVFSGTLASGTYYVEIVWVDSLSHVTLPSPELQVQLISTGSLQIQGPASGFPATAALMEVFIGTTSGGETLQGSVQSSATYTQSSALVAGGALPTVNNTVCLIIANDSAWPSGTGYDVDMTTPAGATIPGFPMQWQILGPGTTLNLSQGLPLYNGTVLYPIPILARPYGHGPQSISGPLSMTNYNVTSVGRLGIGTAVPGWGVDAQGSGIQGMINAENGFLVNGAAPSANTCLGSTDGIANDTQIACITAGSLPTLFYQTVDINAVAQTQRSALNFTSNFTASDSSSPSRTTIDLANTAVSANTYTFPSSVTVDGKGRITAITAGTTTSFVLGGAAGERIMGGSTGTCSSTFSVSFSPVFSSTPVSCQATGVGGSVNVATCTTSTMTGNCSGVSNVYWMALGAN